MRRIIANLLTQQNGRFPYSANGLARLQDNQQLAEILGNIGGDKIIIKGCVKSGSSWSSGYVFVQTDDFPNGEVLYCSGGIGDVYYLKKTPISATADSVTYPNAYTERSLALGEGSEQYDLTEFTSIRNVKSLMSDLQELNTTVQAIIPSPIGAILIWPSDNIPANYVVCDGRLMSKTEYPALFTVLGSTYGASGNQFNIPDMRSLFVVGKGGEYELNSKGGSNSVLLTAAQSGLPLHNHGFQGTYPITAVMGGNGGTLEQTNKTTESTGGTPATEAHENRPPYIALNYIIKVK